MAEKPKKKLADGTLVDVDIAAKTAECDADGNVISSRYATKTELIATRAELIEGINGKANSNHTHSIATSSSAGFVKSSTTGTTANRDYNIQVNTDGTMKVNVPWADNNTWRPIQVNGSTILTSGSSTALNLKAGTNISLSNSNDTVTISSTASGGGMTCSQIFQGAGDLSGSYYYNGAPITISSDTYKMILFEITVDEVNFYLSIPTYHLYTHSSYYYLVVGSITTGAMGIVEVMTNNTDFNVSTKIGEITINSINVYAYK